MKTLTTLLLLLFSFLGSLTAANTHSSETPALTDHFVTTWQTTNASTTITIPTHASSTYSYDIDWNNDGVFDDIGVTGDGFHDYGAAGTHTIRIQGVFPHIHFNNAGDKDKILSIEQWGTIVWGSMSLAFYGASNLVSNATDVPDFSAVTNMHSMFRNATSFNGDVSLWAFPAVTDMNSMFSGATAFNGDVTNWTFPNVISMGAMFSGATAFEGNGVTNWAFPAVTNMRYMFSGATGFNGDVSLWAFPAVTSMPSMFRDATDFNGNVTNWNFPNVTDMQSMFQNATAFNGNVINWNFPAVTNMRGMFHGATAFEGNGVTNWGFPAVTSMRGMFFGATVFNGDVSNWEFPAVTDMAHMFNRATSFDGNVNGGVTNWAFPAVTDMAFMFNEATAFNGNVTNWDFPVVTNMRYMFNDTADFNGDVTNWNFPAVTDMLAMFYKASSFNQNLGAWDISGVSNIESMLGYSGLSQANYDNTLIGWESQAIASKNLGSVSGLTYCLGASARTSLINTYGWTITNDVLDCPPCITATPNNWTGGGDNTTWEDGDNWSAGVPQVCHQVNIPSGFTATITITGNAYAASVFSYWSTIMIAPSAHLMIDGNISGNTEKGFESKRGLSINNGILEIDNAPDIGLKLGNTSNLQNNGLIKIDNQINGHAMDIYQGVFTNAIGAEVKIGTEVGSNITNGIGLKVTGGQLFSNDGSIIIKNINANDGFLANTVSVINNKGSIEIDQIAGDGFNHGTSTSTLINNGTIDINNTGGLAYNSTSNDFLTGSDGTITTDNVVYVATISPSRTTPACTSCQQNINGTLSFYNFGKYLLNVDGLAGGGNTGGHDLVAVTGDLNLNGILEVTLDPGFTPSISDEFIIMTYTGTLTGTFSSLNLPSPQMDGWSIDYSTTGSIILKKIVPCFTWISGAGNWSDASKWTCGVVPSAGNQVYIQTGTVTMDMAANIGELTFENATLTGANTLTITGIMDWESGTIATPLTIANGGILNITANTPTLDAVTMTMDGICNHTGGTLRVTTAGVMHNSGTYYVTGGCMNLADMANFSNSGTLDVDQDGILFKGLGDVSSSGSFLRHGSTGLLEFQNGSFSNSGTFTNNAGTINTSAATTFTNNNLLKGVGTINFGTDFFQNGHIAPGNSPGIITLNKLDNSNGHLDIEMQALNNFDVINVTDAVTLGGTLNISFLNSYEPSVNDAFTIMTCSGGCTGNFSTITHPGNNPNAWQIDLSTPNEVILRLAGPLPVELVDFTVKQQKDNTVLLAWETATERNVSHFEIERSFDALHWEKVDIVAAAGDSNESNHYQFTDTPNRDNQAIIHQVYYRLKIVDNDISFEDSPIRSVTFTGKGDMFTLYPNPSNGILFLEHNQTTALSTQILLTDVSGREIRQNSIVLPKRGTVIFDDLQTLSPGMYFIYVRKNEQVIWKERIVIQ